MGIIKKKLPIFWDRRVSNFECRLFFILDDFCYGRKTSCFPSIATLVKVSGASKRNIIRGLQNLEKTGFLKIKRKEGQHNTYFPLIGIIKKKEQSGVTHGTGGGATHDTGVVPPMTPTGAAHDTGGCQPWHGGGVTHGTRILPIESYQYNLNIRVPTSSSKKSPNPKQKPWVTTARSKRDDVELAINALNFTALAKDFQGLDVLEELEDFKNHFLSKTTPGGKPLFQTRTDWNLTFRTWLRNSRKWKTERGELPQPVKPEVKKEDLPYHLRAKLNGKLQGMRFWENLKKDHPELDMNQFLEDDHV